MARHEERSPRGSATLAQALQSGGGLVGAGEDLFSVTAVLDSSASLRRALTDPSRDAAARRGLVSALFGGRVSASRPSRSSPSWPPSAGASERDLADAVEQLAVETVLAAAEAGGRLDAVEDELFRFEPRGRPATPVCARPSGTAGAVPRTRRRLVGRLVQGKVTPETLRLARQAVHAPRGRHFDRVLEPYVAVAAKRREQLTAVVTAAVPLDDTQRAPARAGAAAASTASPCRSTSSSTPRSWAASGCRSATRSSTAPSCADSKRHGGCSPADRPARPRLQHDGTRRAPPAPDQLDQRESSVRTGRTRGEETLMTELTIRPEEIRDALDNFVQSYEPGAASREEVGRVSDAGDGIAHVEGLPSAMTNELLQFEDGTLGLALNLDVHEIGVVVLGDFAGIEEGQEVQPHRRGPLGPRRRRLPRPRRRPARHADRRPRRDRRPRPAVRSSCRRRGVMARKSVHEPLQTGIKSIDSMIPDRPRPAPAHHRRPPDRQDHGRGRHDHQPEAELGVRRPGQAGALHLRGHRPEGLDDRRRPRHARGGRRAGVHHDRRGPGLRRRRASSTSPPTPARPSASTGCTTASTSSSSSTTCPSRPRPTAPCRCCCAARRAARPTRATSSTCTAACSSAAPSSPTSWATAR